MNLTFKEAEIIKDWTTITSQFNNEKLCWCLESCQSKFYNRGNKWYFVNSQDATFFALKYGELVQDPAPY